MKKFLFILACTIAALYWALHLALGSSPVQRKVVEELKKVLAAYGVNLKIESIEFSAVSPKVYLNKVTVNTTEKAEIRLDVPLTVDKVKIEFSPIALLSKQVIINEAALYNPKVILPRADRLYRRVEKLLKEQEEIELKGGTFNVIVKKIGVVDALFNVVSKNPPFAVRSRSLTAFLLNDLERQKNVSVQTVDLEIDRKQLSLVLNKVDLDVDVSQSSVRLNQAVIEGAEVYADVKGTMSLPFKEKTGPDSINISYEVSVPLDYLNKVPEIEGPVFAGSVASSGTVKYSKGKYSGSGKATYDSLSVDGYKIDHGEFLFDLVEREMQLSSVNLQYGNGVLKSRRVDVSLAKPLTLRGTLNAEGLTLGGILENVKSPTKAVDMRIDTPLEVSGQLSPFKIEAKLDGTISDFKVNDGDQDRVIDIKKIGIAGNLGFNLDQMDFNCLLNGLGGKSEVEGYLGFDSRAKLRVRSEKLSLTELKRISNLSVGGKTDLRADIEVGEDSAKISGSLDIADAEIADLYLGNVKGLAFYRNSLLSFENISMKTALDPVQGSGFVDFRDDGTHYKFRVQATRIGTDEVFEIFRKSKLSFVPPREGEVAARVTIEGGGRIKEEVSVKATGQGRNFTWYGERWSSSQFNFDYTPKEFLLNKVVLFKPSGALDISANFRGEKSYLELVSRGLRIEDIDWTEEAPIDGEIVGSIRLEGEFPYPSGSGNLRLTGARFRGESIEDSSLVMRTTEGAVNVNAELMGERLKGSWSRSKKDKEKWNLLLFFKEFDVVPLLTMFMGKDLDTFGKVHTTGDISLNGRVSDWKTMQGSGTVSTLQVGLKGAPMANRQPLEIKVDKGTVRFNQFDLVGRDGQLLVGLVYKPDERIQASLDGKIDLQFLQPFIPGLDSGNGTVSMGIRISGRPKAFDILGNAVLEDGTFKLQALKDVFQSAQVQLSLSQDRIDIDKFNAQVNGGVLGIQGGFKIGEDRYLVPNLKLSANRIGMTLYDALTTRFTGEFSITGNKPPYRLAGNCSLIEGRLSSLGVETEFETEGTPVFKFDVRCSGQNNLWVRTEALQAEFRGDFHILGDTNATGLLGSADMIGGRLFFRQTQFDLRTGVVRFESKSKVAPRFDLSGTTVVKDKKEDIPQEYEVAIKAIGVPENYRILLTSKPTLAEAEIISLLVLGVTERTNEGNYVELGTALVGQVPIQSKIEEELGVAINISSKKAEETEVSTAGDTTQDPTTDVTVPMVEIQKQIGEKTTLSYSNSIEGSPVRQVKIQHELGDNVTVNGSFVDKPPGTSDTQTVQSYGLDFRYRFKFE